MATTHASYCRICLNGCPISVDVEQGRAIRVTGDPLNDTYQGYTCVKGRALPEQHSHPDRLLRSQKRMPDGTFRSISSDQLLDEIAERLRDLIDRHGPSAVVSYFGTMAANVNTLTIPMVAAFMHAIGSRLQFNPDTIDQAGKQVAKSMHGVWLAPSHGFDDPDVALVIGANPLVSYAGGLLPRPPREKAATVASAGVQADRRRPPPKRFRKAGGHPPPATTRRRCLDPRRPAGGDLDGGHTRRRVRGGERGGDRQATRGAGTVHPGIRSAAGRDRPRGSRPSCQDVRRRTTGALPSQARVQTCRGRER